MIAIRRLPVRLVSIFLFVVFGGSGTSAQTYTFGSAGIAAPSLASISPPPGNQPIITADFNGDGIPDIAIAGTLPSSTLPSGTQAISIYLAKPDGTFGAPANYPLQSGTPPTGLVARDFNGDGTLDLVITGITGTASTYILLANGDGTFQTPIAIANSNYSAAAAGDFNGDGKLDLILSTPNFGSGATLAVLLGNGDGSFQSPATYNVPSGPYLVVGDFNGDGKPDITTAGGSTISVLINGGNGTFGIPINETLTGNIQALAAADVNGDGKLDLLVPFGGATAGVAVLAGNGNGTFGTATVYTNNLLSQFGTSFAISDFNSDGKLDLALTNSTDDGVAILVGNGDGTFQSPPLLYSGGLSPSGIATLDVNGDGKPDLVVAGSSGTTAAKGSLTILLNHGDGTFPAGVPNPTAINPGTAVVGDFNGDGKPDIAVTSVTNTNGVTGTPVSGAISALLGNGDVTFKTHRDSPTQNFPLAIAEGDFSGDGIPDLVAIENTPAGSQILATWIGNGDGTFTEVPGPSLTGMNSVAVGDFNKDGKLDVAAVGINQTNVFVFLGNGDGSFAAPTTYAVGAMSTSPPNHNVLTGDFSGDGKLDLAVATDNGIAILLGNGDGSFQTSTLLPPIAPSAPEEELLALADFNGDGKLDILRSTGNNIIEVALGNGGGTFKSIAGYQLVSTLNAGAVVVGDFNGDGKPDVALVGQSQAMTILFGDGDGTFGAETDYAAQFNASLNFIVSADFNGDDAPDVAMANQTDSDVLVYLSSPVVAFSPRGLTFANVDVGATSPSQAVTLANPSGASLAISGISATGDFTASNNCGSTLPPGKNCQTDVTLSPTAAGTRAGLLSFADNAEPNAETLVLTGTGADFTIAVAAGAPTSAMVTAGQTASYSLALTPEDGFTGTTSITCAGAPAEAVCSVNPGSVALDGAAPSTTTVTLTTTAASFSQPKGDSPEKWPPVMEIVVVILLIALQPRGNNRLATPVFRYARRAVLTAVLLTAALTIGCGGSSNTRNNMHNAGTPAGDYTLTVTAASGSLTHSVSLHLEVQ